MSLVLDSLATLAWLYSDETSDALKHLCEYIADNGAIAPALWSLGIANSLTLALRRDLIDEPFRRDALTELSLLDMTIDQTTFDEGAL